MKGFQRDYNDLFYFVYYSLKSFRMVHGQVGQDFPVEFNVVGFHLSHELAVGHPVHPGTRVDTGDPEGAEISLLVSAVPVGVHHGFLHGVLGYGPHIFTSSKVTFGLLEHFFPSGSGSN